MGGRSCVFDNIFTEGLWCTVKYEEAYLHDYGNINEVEQSLSMYFKFYNNECIQSSLGDLTKD